LNIIWEGAGMLFTGRELSKSGEEELWHEVKNRNKMRTPENLLIIIIF
jgi:hypothetical protein